MAGAGLGSVDEVWSLVVVPPDDAGQRRIHGQRDEDVSGVLGKRGQPAVTWTSGLVTTFVPLFVQLRRE